MEYGEAKKGLTDPSALAVWQHVEGWNKIARPMSSSFLGSGFVYTEDCYRFSDSLNRATSEAQLSLQ